MVLIKRSGSRKGGEPSTQQLFIGLITLTVFLYVFAFLNLQDDDTRTTTPVLKQRKSFTSATNSYLQQQQQHHQHEIHDNTNNLSYYLAQEQSLNFFTDITDTDWKIQQAIYHGSQPNHNRLTPRMRKVMSENPAKFWADNYEPELTCAHQRRLGGLGDGGKWVCDPRRIVASADEQSYTSGKTRCVVYSVGSNGNAHFEQSVNDALKEQCSNQLEIHTFDLKNWNKRNGNFGDRVKEAGGTFHHWGITTKAGLDFNATDYFLPKTYRESTFKSFGQTFVELGHTNRVIDILKIDCEGCEWQSLEGWLSDWNEHGVTVRQLLLELHDAPPDRTIAFF
mmetsp:Transcript_18345/g.27180  ORF Transcript_18345/g.27180 Transcript_18345/m.27180 type:complete len:337 (+) Transcript_18345:130-1140(+)